MPFKQVSTLTPQQQQYQNQLLQSLQGLSPEVFDYLQQIISGSPEAFAEFEAPYIRQFERDIIPGIAERFGAGAGSHGALSSGGLNQALAQAGTDLSTNLAALRSGLRGQAIGQLQGFQSPAFQQSFENVYKPKRPGFFKQLLGGLGTGLGFAGGTALTSALGGPASAGIAGILSLLSGRGD